MKRTIIGWLIGVVMGTVGATTAYASTGHHFRDTHHPFWVERNCANVDAVNCFARDPGDGGTHPHYRRQWGGLYCVFFAGTRRYANGHDYCLQR